MDHIPDDLVVYVTFAALAVSIGYLAIRCIYG